ncbi:RloB family protein [Actinoplanes sp. CA-142083]|uniref:RloB family protein n=1 Tax=Actinoplanes sp. CA-142083 TaxID=3239903 RepID=UPI003D923744
MVRREPPRGRRGPIRDPRRTFLIVIGAGSTELAYLEGLRDHRRLATMEIVTKPSAPDQLVAYARKRRDLAEFDEVWCVTDVDHYESEGRKVTVAAAAAKQTGISIAVSNPCFELWLLLHHEDRTAFLSDCGAVTGQLRKHVRNYDKARLRFSDFAGGVDRAIERARKLDPTGNDHTRNPSTSVWRLVGAVLENQ